MKKKSTKKASEALHQRLQEIFDERNAHDKFKEKYAKERKEFIDHLKDHYSADNKLSFSLDIPTLAELIKPTDPSDYNYFSVNGGYQIKNYSYALVNAMCYDNLYQSWGGYTTTDKLDTFVNFFQAGWLQLIGFNANGISDNILEDLIRINPIIVRYIPEERLTDSMKMTACILQPRVSKYFKNQNKELQEFLTKEFECSEILNYVQHPLPHIWNAVAASIITSHSSYVFKNSNRIEFKRLKWGRSKELYIWGSTLYINSVPDFIRNTLMPISDGGNPVYKEILLEIAEAIETEIASKKLLKEIE